MRKDPGQTLVDVFDQSLFTSAKQIQWMYPEKLGTNFAYLLVCILKNDLYYCLATLFQVMGYLSYLESSIYPYVVSRL